MTGFQHVGVLDSTGPHVTPMAGVHVGSRYWATTSTTAAKVRAVRAGSPAAILDQDDDGWTMTTGPVTVLDLRRPLAGLADPVAMGLAGPALARLGLAHVDQIAGYLRDGAAVPAHWRPADRVLLVVQVQHRLRWSDGSVDEATDAFARCDGPGPATRRLRHAVPGAILDGLAPGVRLLLEEDRPCSLGLATSLGPVVVPGRWDRRGAVAVDRGVLGHLHARLPGACAVMLDDDGDGPARPTSKRGVLLRGEGALLPTAGNGGRDVHVAVRVARATSWTGFDTTTATGTPRAS